MTSDEKSFFEIVDDYARTHHKCLVTEMFVSGTNLEYAICFRPLVSEGQRDRRSGCKYVYVAINEVQTIGQTKNLSDVLRETLDAQLPLISIR
jgi:hypothetical protein